MAKRNSPRAAFFRRPVRVAASWPKHPGIIVECGVTARHRTKRPDEWQECLELDPSIDPATIDFPLAPDHIHVGVMTADTHERFTISLVQALFACGAKEVRAWRADSGRISYHINMPVEAMRCQ